MKKTFRTPNQSTTSCRKWPRQARTQINQIQNVKDDTLNLEGETQQEEEHDPDEIIMRKIVEIFDENLANARLTHFDKQRKF